MSSFPAFSICYILCCLFFSHVDCYPRGSPWTGCFDGNPIHKTKESNRTVPYDPQPAATNPFTFTTDSTTYKPGQSLRVSISSDNGTYFEGYFLQARSVSTATPVGAFTGLPALSQFLLCVTPSDSTGKYSFDSVTHTGEERKEATTFVWKAPEECVGDISFIGSVAITHSTFYSDMTSSIITCKAGCLQANIGLLALSSVVALLYKTTE
ncbi:putative defense protein 3 [Lytechinus variegatus]|uniref:putative defense protein 3 n=1 Tax=Lytechinus variegatus TaxID=7654 RepID=UPI001BB208FC|nr:putative defense protein 3 [Lytechinus variegatus]